MNSADRYHLSMEVFDEVCELPPEVRGARMDELCGDDAALRRDVESLLRADSGDHRLVDSADSGESLERIADGIEFTCEMDGQALQQIGAYRIVREIGRGGMGIIYEARQESPSRRVALKVLRAGLIDREMLKRFQHEAHVLGQLQHSGIAQIFEAGVADTPLGKQPFLVMELIEGEPLDAAADANELNTRQRLELLARVCDAVQHAHQKGIIHRDLKPSNVLVTTARDDTSTRTSPSPTSSSTISDVIGQPKVLDFGIARVTDSDMQTVTVQTEVGQLVGTLAYMSPEQVEGNSADLDTRCDVYALGVMLYELLAHRRPHDLSGLPVTEAARRIREEVPARLGAIEKRFRGDVETIVAKALEHDRERRYGSAAELATDIRRHLNDQPIDARPASTFYQIRKFAKRNKGLVGGVCVALLALAIGLVATGISLKRANEATKLAKTESRRAQDESKRAQDESERARKALADVQLVSKFQDAILKRINVQEMGTRILDEIKSQVAGDKSDSQWTSLLHEVNPASLARAVVDGSMLSKASQAAREGFTDRPVLEANILESLCETYFALGMCDQSLKEGKDALALQRKYLGDDDPATIKMIGNMAFMLNNLRRAKEAEPYAEEALKRRLATLPEDDALVLEAYYRLAGTKQHLGKLDEAIEISKKLVRVGDRVLDVDDDHRLLYRQQLANIYSQAKQPEKALPIREELLKGFRRLKGENDPMTLGAWSQVAKTYNDLGRLDEGESILKEVVPRASATLGETDPRSLLVLRQLAIVQQRRGELDEARTSFQKLLEQQKRVFPPGHPAIQETIKALKALDEKSVQP